MATRDDYRPVSVTIEPEQRTAMPTIKHPPHLEHGQDITVALSQWLRGPKNVAAFAELLTLALVCTKSARSVYVRGGTHEIRQAVAYVLATAYSPRTFVEWEAPDLGIAPAPMRSRPPAARPVALSPSRRSASTRPIGRCSEQTNKGKPCPTNADRVHPVTGLPVCHSHDPNGKSQQNIRARRQQRERGAP